MNPYMQEILAFLAHVTFHQLRDTPETPQGTVGFFDLSGNAPLRAEVLRLGLFTDDGNGIVKLSGGSAGDVTSAVLPIIRGYDKA